MPAIRGFLRRIWVLLWKGFIFRFRFWFYSLIEILIPLVVVIVLLAIKSLGSATPPDVEPERIPSPTIPSLKGYQVNLCYTPKNDFTIKLMKNIEQPNLVIIPTSNEDDLVSRIESFQLNSDSKAMGIVFLGEAKEGASTVSTLEYKLRTISNWNTKDTQPQQFYPGPSVSNTYPYFDSGFAALQILINNAFISLNSNEKYVFQIQEFPYPKFIFELSNALNEIFISMIFLGFITMGSRLSHNILTEKQSGIKELQKMNGISSSFLWFGWYINTLLIYLPVIIIMTILLCGWIVKSGPIIEYSDPLVIFISLFLFVTATVVFIFFITTWFSRPLIGMIVVSLLWIVLSNVKLTILWSDNSYMNALFFIKAIEMAFSLVLNFESRKVGIKWNNLTYNVNGVSMLGIWLMFILDIFLGAVLIWYIDQLKPGKYGVSKSWYFPIEKLVRKLRHRIGHLDPLIGNENSEGSLDFEPVPMELEPGIEISQIRKLFGKKVAVDRVNLTIYKNEITVLLGHNGAGKTTLMSMITGLYSPTEGVIRIDGKNVANELDIIRKSIGLCPQENMHFSEFTVYEHLLFFSMIKGNTRKEACDEANDLLKLLNIDMKRNELAKKLSGGMKRKLSLAIALIGHAQVVILDEPTSGMDPQSRRAIWDHLLRIRGQRTILITTHFMEEADVLGDRIAIMAQGRVRCFGTPLFLKAKFGSGYQLRMLYNKPDQLDEITRLVKSQVPGAKLETSYRSLLTYSLPITSTPKFPQLFEMLDKQKISLGIDSLGVAVSSLEDVFLSLEKDNESNLAAAKKEHTIDHLDTSKFQYTRLGGSSLFLQRTKALLVKKLICTWRRWYLLILEIIIPILIILYAMYLSYHEDQQPQLTISLDLYPKSQIMIETNNQDWKNAYSGFIKHSDSTLVPTTNINQSLLKIGYKDIIDYREHYLVASKAENNIITALYSTLGLHTIPVTIDMASDVILKIFTGSKKYSIKTINHPIPDTTDLYNSGNSAPMTWMTIVPLGMTIILGIISQFPLNERVSNSKQIQFMAGVSPFLYWTINFLFDLLIYFLITALMLVTIAIYDQGENFSSYEYEALFVIFFLYGICSIWLTYFITFFLNTLSAALNILFTLNIITGLVFPLIILLLSPWKKTQNALEHIFLFSPQYAFSQALYKIFTLVFVNSKCRNTDFTLRRNLCKANPLWECCACKDDACSLLYPYFKKKNFQHEGVWDELWYFIADFFIFLLIVALIESGILKRLQAKLVHTFFNRYVPNDATLDEDVIAEKKLTQEELNGLLSTSNIQVTYDNVSSGSQNITSSSHSVSMLLANDLVKQYGCSFLAVKGVSFRVGRGECFGLLGVNGAGKTTTFKILTAEIAPTQGEAKLDGYLLSRHWNQYMSRIGYCPQFDPINEVLTGRETLTFYAKIRGKHPEQINYEVDQWMDLLGLNIYQNVLCGTYSGGNKRKLSTAIALIAKPDIVFLDEPTSGVDPVSRRNLWNVVEMTKREGKSLVLTSHSMEECEALCDRLGIMVAGQLKCLGPIQYLKEKFGKGYNIQLKMAPGANYASIQEVKTRFENIFKGCQLKDEHKTLLQYEVTNPSITLAILFRAMEDLKAHFKYILENYTVSQTTLEQIFLSFAQ